MNELHYAKIKEGVSEWNSWYRSVPEMADLRGADLRVAYLPAPSMLLLASWGGCSPTTTTALMRLDASAHPKGEAVFTEWANGGACPYRDCRFERVVRFNECRELWSPGAPPTLYEAVCMVLDEHCPTWEGAT